MLCGWEGEGATVAQAVNPSTAEAEAGGSLELEAHK